MRAVSMPMQPLLPLRLRTSRAVLRHSVGAARVGISTTTYVTEVARVI